MSEFISFSLAKKLKDVGFILNSSDVYGKFDSDGVFHSQLYVNFTETMDNEEIIAPTISQVLTWLRNEKFIDVCVDPIIPHNLKVGGNKYGYRIYKDYLPIKLPEDIRIHYPTREECEISGIEYVVDNFNVMKTK